MNPDEIATVSDAQGRSQAGSASPSPPGARADATPPVRDRGSAATRTLALIAVLLAAGAASAAAYFWQRSERVVQESARRLQEADVRIVQLDQQVRQAQEQVRDLLGRSAVLENRLAETVGQQAQLERLYKNIAQDSVDAVLADVENALSIASQQLLVGANVPGALAALQDAESRLKRADQPAVLTIRRLVTRDIDRLKAVQVTDVTSLTVRLDSVAASIDQLPLIARLSSAPDRAASAKVDAEAEGSVGPIGRIADSGLRGWQALLAELRSLFRVNRLDSPDAVLLAPEQQYFVRENLRMTLLSARIAALSRNDTLFHADLDRAIGWLGTYYDKDQRTVAGALASLRQLQSSRLSIELPSLAESLSAVRASRVSRDGRS